MSDIQLLIINISHVISADIISYLDIEFGNSRDSSDREVMDIKFIY